MLRVIAGKYRGMKLELPNKNTTRPTTDRMKEANFSSLQFFIEGKIFLDLFSGSGSNPIEAVSRGAMKAIAVEKDNFAYKVLLNNIAKVKAENIDTYLMDALIFLKSKKGMQVDVIYLDPPFKDVMLLNQCLKLISENNFLNKTGKILIETHKDATVEIPEKMIIVKDKSYGKKIMLFVQHVI
ncbi:16S rRNA (guanine966-N2)-methyltransferase [Mycoplasma testudineum]|uniref:16S rRNA (Guanine966-N2)-methyltransferase n=1 Tax=Mycoplasma testudineum TaxID=244584 RepID=A0A4R6IC73_9MOLU|nr:16S rRNA (guanine(966)-N(2))-methyltransferase RsmD [Mycoplasma testudineum]OYD26602.1 16S rRNA (guanine(966)-N(2))-methyltransferase RsmD [Mycoplasma testudineum]TDO19434.1 16S rRNA (guanine966-N2)-methyltransferase [Mycoplasma testudineum]